MNYKFYENISRETFDQYVSTCESKSIFQSSKWADLKQEWEPLFTAIKENQTIVAASLVLIRKLPMGYTLFYLPRGPIIDYFNQGLLNFYFDQLKQTAKKHKAVMIKIDPNIVIESLPIKNFQKKNKTITELENLNSCGFKHLGFGKGLYDYSQPRYDACLYYQENIEEQLKVMPAYKQSKTAQKKGVYIKELKYDELSVFSELMKLTEQRKGVRLRNLEYFQRMAQVFGDNCYVVVAMLDQKQRIAECLLKISELKISLENNKISNNKLNQTTNQITSLEKEVAFLKEKIEKYGNAVAISGQLALRDSKTCYLLYAGTNIEYKKYYGPYLAYFARIKWGFKHGCTVCNYGGLPGTLDDGLTEFKSHFNPNIDEYIGEFDLVIKRFVYICLTSLLPIYKKIRKMFS